MASYTFSNPPSKNTQHSVTTSSFTSSAGRSDVQAAKRLSRATRTNQAQPLSGGPVPREALNLAPDFLVGYTSADPMRDTWIIQQFGKAGLTGVVAKGRRK